MEQPMLAALAFRRALAVEPGHREARAQLRRLRRGPDPKPLPALAPPSTPWTGTLITESALGRKIGYAPQKPGMALKFGAFLRDHISHSAATLVRSVLPPETVLSSIVDLRCASGLFMSNLIRHVRAERAIGVGLTSQSLRSAKRKKVFTEFVEGQGLDVLDGIEGEFDVIAALDIFFKMGPLEEAFQKIAGRLTSRGMIVYSIDLGAADADWKQIAPRRAVHTVGYIQRLATENGLTPIAGEEIVTRIEYTKEFHSYVGVLART
jgi:predicted TPR repeat methyltransferase